MPGRGRWWTKNGKISQYWQEIVDTPRNISVRKSVSCRVVSLLVTQIDTIYNRVKQTSFK